MQWLLPMALFGLSAGVVGKYKGGSFWLWFLVGACLPILGTIAAALHRSDRHEPIRRCEECGAVQTVLVQVCRRCGADLDWPREYYVPGEGLHREPSGAS